MSLSFFLFFCFLQNYIKINFSPYPYHLHHHRSSCSFFHTHLQIPYASLVIMFTFNTLPASSSLHLSSHSLPPSPHFPTSSQTLIFSHSSSSTIPLRSRLPPPSRHPKMAILVRSDLPLSPSRISLQAAHAAVSLYHTIRPKEPSLRFWLSNGQRKTLHHIHSEQQLQLVANRARALKLPHVIVKSPVQNFAGDKAHEGQKPGELIPSIPKRRQGERGQVLMMSTTQTHNNMSKVGISVCKTALAIFGPAEQVDKCTNDIKLTK